MNAGPSHSADPGAQLLKAVVRGDRRAVETLLCRRRGALLTSHGKDG